MNNQFTFAIHRIAFDENYRPEDNTRLTTNFANLARGEYRQQNLRQALEMIDNRFNALASWDNPNGDRYSVELEIISADMHIEGTNTIFPSIEVLKTSILDNQTGEHIDGLVGNNLSSYVRDYDFSVRLLDHNKYHSEFSVPDNFGELHGKLFQSFVHSDAYKACFDKPPVICLSVSDNKTYSRTHTQHPLLGVEYTPNEPSLTEQYFNKMGFKVRYLMPAGSVAPLAFYFYGDLLNDYSNLELIATISTMETFQKIYRPEIYNANTTAGEVYRPSLKHRDHSFTQIVYDRLERSQLAVKQGRYTEEYLIKPYGSMLEQWAENYAG